MWGALPAAENRGQGEGRGEPGARDDAVSRPVPPPVRARKRCGWRAGAPVSRWRTDVGLLGCLAGPWLSAGYDAQTAAGPHFMVTGIDAGGAR